MRVGFAIILTVVIASSILLNSYTILPLAFGHGLGKQETQPQNVDDRIAFMNVKIAPELIEYGKLKDIVLTMELVDAQTEEKIPGTAYHLIIEKFADDTLLLDEAFHIMSDSDTLVINFKTTDEGDVVVNGMKMGETLGYMASEDELVVGGPIFNQLGLYLGCIVLRSRLLQWRVRLWIRIKERHMRPLLHLLRARHTVNLSQN